jgi:hypothetical protein
LPLEKKLTKNYIGFANRENFSQERIWVLPIEKILAKKGYGFWHRKKFNQKKKKFNQENILVLPRDKKFSQEKI